MHITVMMFGPARNLVDRDHIVVEVPDGACIKTVRDELARSHPGIASALSTVRFAVNRTFASDAQEVRPDDEVAVIPPVSGG